eukprot:7742856-Pyramimonas_sp.AAC.1
MISATLVPARPPGVHAALGEHSCAGEVVRLPGPTAGPLAAGQHGRGEGEKEEPGDQGAADGRTGKCENFATRGRCGDAPCSQTVVVGG